MWHAQRHPRLPRPSAGSRHLGVALPVGRGVPIPQRRGAGALDHAVRPPPMSRCRNSRRAGVTDVGAAPDRRGAEGRLPASLGACARTMRMRMTSDGVGAVPVPMWAQSRCKVGCSPGADVGQSRCRGGRSPGAKLGAVAVPVPMWAQSRCRGGRRCGALGLDLTGAGLMLIGGASGDESERRLFTLGPVPTWSRSHLVPFPLGPVPTWPRSHLAPF